jgi:hypothetical protein
MLSALLLAAAVSLPSAELKVTVDSVHKQVIVSAGPFDLPDMSGMDAEMHHGAPEVFRFQWPVDGYMRGFDVEMRDGHGKPLPREVVHHLIGVNFDRRQIVYPMVERLFGWGTETDPVMLPGDVGVPLPKGDHLGVYTMWHNETGKDIHDAYLRVILPYIPANKKPVAVLPVYVDVNNHIGGVTTFDVPPGKSERSYVFEFPLSGKLIGIGGHIHDYGVAVRFEDAETGKQIVRLKADRDKDGHVSKIGRFIWGFHENAVPIEAHHKYRVVAEYDNPTGKTIHDGGMGHINGAFSPDDMKDWPKLDPNDPMVKKDIAALPSAGSEMRMSGSKHQHATPSAAMDHPGMKMDGANERMMMTKPEPAKDSIRKP